DDGEWRILDTIGQIYDLLEVVERDASLSSLDDPIVAARYVVTTLGDGDQAALAEILGVDPRTLRTWRTDATVSVRKNPERIVVVAQLVHELLRSFTPHGTITWFRRPRLQLGGESPLSLLVEDPLSADEPLKQLARGGSAQLAT